MLRRPHPSTDREGEPSDEEGFGGDTERDHRPVRKRDQKESVTGDTAKPMQATTRHGMQPSPEASATASSWTALRRTTHDPDRRPTRMGHLDITGIVRPSQRDMPCDTRGHLCISATPPAGTDEDAGPEGPSAKPLRVLERALLPLTRQIVEPVGSHGGAALRSDS